MASPLGLLCKDMDTAVKNGNTNPWVVFKEKEDSPAQVGPLWVTLEKVPYNGHRPPGAVP